MDNRQATLELGTKPVGKLLAQYALPAIIAMTASSLYNMIDSIFIGQGVGALAISGLAITFPLMNLSAAFGAAVGIGSSTCISVKLGQKDYKMAEHIFGNSFTLNLIVGVAFGVITLLFLDPILYFFGASENTIPYARDYMLVILAGNVVSQTFLGMNAVLRAASKPRQAMAATILTVILNIVLAPIFIWPLGMGIQGAALATILSQLVALMWQLKLFSNQQEILHFQRGIYKLKKDIVKNITSIGMSPFAMNVCACVVVIFINAGLSHYGGDMAVGAYGIASKVSFIFVMVTIGLNQGMLPIAGYNYGAQRFDRLMKVLNIAMITATIITSTGGHRGYKNTHAGLPDSRLPDGNNQLLPVHRQGENQHFPVALAPDAVPPAAARNPAAHHEGRRSVDGDAHIRRRGGHSGLCHDGKIHEKV